MADSEKPDPKAVAHAATRAAARMNELQLTYAEIARRQGPSHVTLKAFLDDRVWISRRDRRAGLAIALRWQPDAIDRLARYEEPVEIDATPLDGSTAEVMELLRVLVQQNRDIAGVLERNASLEEALRAELADFQAELHHELRGIAEALGVARPRRPLPPEES